MINIVDYLEMTDELWRVNDHLTAISHKIGSGIGIVALQKKEHAKYGRGQEFSAEKSKIYLSVDKGKLTIVKGKSWAMKRVDPQGLSIKFSISGGCQLTPLTGWHYPDTDKVIFKPVPMNYGPQTGKLLEGDISLLPDCPSCGQNDWHYDANMKRVCRCGYIEASNE